MDRSRQTYGLSQNESPTFVMKNDSGFLKINSNICHGQFWQKEVFFRHPVGQRYIKSTRVLGRCTTPLFPSRVSTGLSTAVRGYWSFISFYSQVFSPQCRVKHRQQSINKTDGLNNKAFTFFNSSSSQSESDRKIFPDAPALLQPLHAPPSRLFTSSLLSSWLVGWQRVGGPLPQSMMKAASCWQKSCDVDAPLPRELFVVGVTCRPAHRTALLTLPQFSPTPRWQISNGLFPHLPTDSPPLFHLSPAEFRTFDASSTHVGYANSVILIKILLLCHKFVWKIQWSSYIWYKNQLPRDFASKENLWTWTEEEREKNAQVAHTWRGQACPSPDRWRRALDKDYLFQC